MRYNTRVTAAVFGDVPKERKLVTNEDGEDQILISTGEWAILNENGYLDIVGRDWSANIEMP